MNFRFVAPKFCYHLDSKNRSKILECQNFLQTKTKINAKDERRRTLFPFSRPFCWHHLFSEAIMKRNKVQKAVYFMYIVEFSHWFIHSFTSSTRSIESGHYAAKAKVNFIFKLQIVYSKYIPASKILLEK